MIRAGWTPLSLSRRCVAPEGKEGPGVVGGPTCMRHDGTPRSASGLCWTAWAHPWADLLCGCAAGRGEWLVGRSEPQPRLI